jgi:tRNA-Thr(GGU) m(6)t(6)A37 methyltransferase TsaA
MSMMSIPMEPIGYVEAGRVAPDDDYWGEAESRIVLSGPYGPEALQGIEDFSHAEIIFVLDRVSEEKVISGARHPRNNPDWPEVGVFAQRTKNRPNRIGATICRILRQEGRALIVAELDAIDGTPVLDIKPVMAEFLPREEVRQPLWSHELMRFYWSKRGI